LSDANRDLDVHWLLVHWKEWGIGAIVFGGFGALMHLLSVRKISLETKKLRLEIDSIRANNEKLSLEIERLKKQKDRDEKAEKVNILAKRIIDYAKKESTDRSGERRPIAKSANSLSEALHESLADVNDALSVLKGQGDVRYHSAEDAWIFS
jgi:hypothetical protein